MQIRLAFSNKDLKLFIGLVTEESSLSVSILFEVVIFSFTTSTPLSFKPNLQIQIAG